MRRILGASLPKSGTHLLASIFRELGFETAAVRKEGVSEIVDVRILETARPGDLYYYGHLRARQSDVVEAAQKNGFRVVVLLRDPRDVCLSMVDFLQSGRPAAIRRGEPQLTRMSRSQLLRGVICGFDLPGYRTPPMADLAKGWLEWREHGAVVIRYEELAIAARGGPPIESVEKLGIAPAAFCAATAAVFGDTSGKTFNKGVCGRWQAEFDSEARELWRRTASGVSAYLGYPEAETTG